MITLSINADQLNETTLIAKKERIKGASIFPFFCKSGQVKQLMVLLPDFKNVFVVPFKKGLVSVSIFSVVRLSMDLAELKSYSSFTPEQIDHLYHYDPNWHLCDERFLSYWPKALISQSNCADYLGNKVRHILFSRDLSMLEHLVMKSVYQNMFKPITPEMALPAFPPAQSVKYESATRSATGGWQIDPIWNNWRIW
jgi:hypothetical protein